MTEVARSGTLPVSGADAAASCSGQDIGFRISSTVEPELENPALRFLSGRKVVNATLWCEHQLQFKRFLNR